MLEESSPVALVRVAGELDLASSVEIRAALHKALAEQPSGIVVDVAGLTVEDDLTLTVFSGFAGTAAELAGCPVALCAPTTAVHTALQRLAIDWSVPVHPTREQAVVAIEARPPVRRYRRRLTGTPAAPGQARKLLVEVCREWRLPAGLSDNAEVVATELVSNAVRHAGGDLTVSVALGNRYIHVSVRDGSPVSPTRQIPDPYHGGGRGLILIDAFTASWGTTLVAGGKVVWATLRLPDQ
jgi:anti-anti-sigma regulatory factor/anti-sigma regulatory factor (Ser/Thr protein kinase)